MFWGFFSVQRSRFGFIMIFAWYAGHKGGYRNLSIGDPVIIDVNHLSPWQHAEPVPCGFFKKIKQCV